MFTDCASVSYANLTNFIIHSPVDILDQFTGVNQNVKICVEELNYRNYLTSSSFYYCNNNWFKKGIKIYLRKSICINIWNETFNNKYEYFNLCFQGCPIDTYPIINEYLFIDKTPEGYYLNINIKNMSIVIILVKIVLEKEMKQLMIAKNVKMVINF